ncbi:MAG: DUF2169 domain-containing protein [Geobacteraceae bacterium]|nr:DUF2169 domain-containing protein [Geobacteraceae bacterium]
MQFTNTTQFPAIAFQATDQHGQSSDVVIVRATYNILEDGALAVADQQKPIVLTDEYFGEINKSSVRQESDLVPYKPRCDVIVNATAYAPGGTPSLGFTVGVRITGAPRENGETGQMVLDKNLFITGPRFWEKSLTGKWHLKPPTAPITTLPIRYEYAFGGECRIPLGDPVSDRVKEEFRLMPEQRDRHPEGPEKAPLAHTCCESNPLGIGFTEAWYLKAKKLKRIQAPQIDAPENPGIAFGENPPPQGFGVIAKAWKQRLQLAGTYDDAWLETRWPDFPENFDMAYWNGANQDMQTPHLAGGEEITLTNLTPGGTLRFTLPVDKLVLNVRFESGKTASVAAKLDTVIVEPDSMKIAIVWRAILPIPPEITVAEARMVQNMA